MYSFKFDHYLKSKIPDIQISELYTDLCIPGKSHQKFYEKVKETKVNMIRFSNVEVVKQGKQISIKYNNGSSKKETITVDMVILAPAIEPTPDAAKIAKTLGIALDDYGFFKEDNPEDSSVVSSKPGVFIVGCSQGAKNIQESVLQASAAVGKILSSS
jgi:heterodisulfide reductase subunit A